MVACDPVREGPAALLALAPEDSALAPAVGAFETWLLNELDTLAGATAGTGLFSDYVRVFASETGAESLEEYIGALEYDSVPQSVPKVALALVVQSGTSTDTNDWIYATTRYIASKIWEKMKKISNTYSTRMLQPVIHSQRRHRPSKRS